MCLVYNVVLLGISLMLLLHSSLASCRGVKLHLAPAAQRHLTLPYGSPCCVGERRPHAQHAMAGGRVAEWGKGQCGPLAFLLCALVAGCCICGQPAMQYKVSAASTVASLQRDTDEMAMALTQQVPDDVAADQDSLQAAKAAISKAADVVRHPDFCYSCLPELLMAWFYAGYHLRHVRAPLAILHTCDLTSTAFPK